MSVKGCVLLKDHNLFEESLRSLYIPCPSLHFGEKMVILLHFAFILHIAWVLFFYKESLCTAKFARLAIVVLLVQDIDRCILGDRRPLNPKHRWEDESVLRKECHTLDSIRFYLFTYCKFYHVIMLIYLSFWFCPKNIYIILHYIFLIVWYYFFQQS